MSKNVRRQQNTIEGKVEEVVTGTGTTPKYSKADEVLNKRIDNIDLAMGKYSKKIKEWGDKLEKRVARLEDAVFNRTAELSEVKDSVKETKEEHYRITESMFQTDDGTTVKNEISEQVVEEVEAKEKHKEELKKTSTCTRTREDEFIPFKAQGPGRAYKYWDYTTQTYGVKTDLWAAKQAGNGEYTPIWVWYEDGAIDHLMSPEEIKKYTP